jgi:hypothetical protein
MRKLLLVALLLIACCLPLYTYTQVSRIRKKGAAGTAPVEAVLPVSREELTRVVVETFRDRTPPPPGKFSRFSLALAGEESFPEDHQLRNYHDEESMRRYLSLAPARRQYDFYLYDFSDADNRSSYWESEYYNGDEALPFRCNFIIHQEPAEEGHTRVEIFEFAPRVWAGKKFALERHGPGYYLNIKNVEPTTSDRAELLEFIKEAVRPNAAP